MNSGEKLTPRRFRGGTFDLLIEPCGGSVFGLNKAHAALHEFANFTATQVGMRKITVWDKSTLRLSPNVNVAYPALPRSNCQSESLAFSIRRRAGSSASALSVWLLASSS